MAGLRDRQKARRREAIMAAAHTDVEIPKPDPRVWKKYQEDNQKLDALFGKPAGKP